MINEYLNNIITIDVLLNVYKKLNYKVFENNKVFYNLNIGVVRSNDNKANTFNDILFVFYKEKSEWVLIKYPITADPGITYLKTPMNSHGTAILCEGQYIGLYKYGFYKHRDALLQVSPVKYYLDNNRDIYLDRDPKTIKEGIIGTHIHPHFQNSQIAERIENSSAGCQVFADNNDYIEFMNLIKKSIKNLPNSFTYTIINENQLIN